MPVKGGYLALVGGGALLVWSGLKGKSWSTVLRDIAQGRKPSAALTAYTIPGTPANAAPGGIASGGPPPAAPSSGIWNTATLTALWVSAGGPPGAARNAVCHAMQESSGNAKVTSANPDGGINVGLWQLDTRGVGAGYSVAQLQNPFTNARITVRATRGGQDWADWSTPGC
jgi:Lysozyme like domain